ncbi:MAG: hypothetical protein ACI932_002160 [Paracoccaceae bacterium]|jgi:hypothetical protein
MFNSPEISVLLSKPFPAAPALKAHADHFPKPNGTVRLR